MFDFVKSAIEIVQSSIDDLEVLDPTNLEIIKCLNLVAKEVLQLIDIVIPHSMNLSNEIMLGRD